MGYACPVCATPQRDGEHLAHHLAFTAMLHGDDHEAWLDDHAPGWETADPAGLAEDVVDHAEPAEYHEVFEDTTDRGRPDLDPGMGSGHDHPHDDGRHGGTPISGAGTTDPETAAALREARDLTRRMYEDEGEEDENDGTPESDDGSPSDGSSGDDPSR
ncbi:hypothetical protein DQW50_10720 [Halorubrum sp. 48-1-W]|uniref:DUF5810 domain-containing protein n=1 Tax=Halorubrum sp. 48-1-W TaxID=2249761 RepID=UPI000DCDC751|nr:DUF5810 domain-containing protein [Halorubrum sp. 48-1-W]RAW45108.1 hypothetical protein DQW50_10720 [Halorubrum sp. 48-1-W]